MEGKVTVGSWCDLPSSPFISTSASGAGAGVSAVFFGAGFLGVFFGVAASAESAGAMLPKTFFFTLHQAVLAVALFLRLRAPARAS